MLLAWLLPDASYLVLFEGWGRPPYVPRHGKPPLPVRMARRAAVAITAARERERAAYAEFDHVGRARIDEMFTLNRGGLDNVGHVLDQMGPTWEAQAEVTRQLADPEAGQ